MIETYLYFNQKKQNNMRDNMNNFTIGIDVDGTKTAYGLFDTNKKLIFKNNVPNDTNLDRQTFFDEITGWNISFVWHY